ncbi:amidohydrolase [Flavobacteriaceae bacterium]|nr:amidohydrolase [Flavobacteriaceae bacterium]
MKVGLLQFDIKWEDPIANLSYIERQMQHIKADLLVLPEMFLTGFSMNPSELSLNWPFDPYLVALQTLSQKYEMAICGSVMVNEHEHFYNRMVFIQPDRAMKYYDKRHLFSLAGENESYTPGNRRVIVEFKGFRILLQVCYDLRFPVFSRVRNDYDLVIYVANWPSKRISAWNALLKARAIENMSFVIGVNRIGEDGNYYHYPGHSRVYTPLGKKLVDLKNDGLFRTVELDLEKLNKKRNRLGFLKDQDDFDIIM